MAADADRSQDPNDPNDTNNDTNNDPSDPWRIMAPVKGRIGAAMALSVAAAVCGMLALGMLTWMVRDLLATPARSPWLWLAAALGLSVVAAVLRLHAFNQSHYAAFRLENLLRTRLCAHIARLPLGVLQAFGAAAMTKVIQDDVKALHVFVADSTPMYARAYATPLLTLMALAWLDWRLMLAACVVLATGFAILWPAMRDHARMSARYNFARERVAAAITEFVQAMPVVRNFDTGFSTFSRFQHALDGYRTVVTDWSRSVGFTARFSLALLNPLPTLLVLLWLGAWLTESGNLALHRWLGALLLGTGMAESILPLMSLYRMVEKSKLSVRRIQQVLALAPLEQVGQGRDRAVARGDSAWRPDVRFESVSFCYEGQARPALEQISFHAAAGKVTALVGASGAGKSTVARLIPRFHDVSAGRILVGGEDVRSMAPDALMGCVAFVFQENFLFGGSIADNIRLGRPDAADADMIAAAQAAQAHDFITALPQGYATPVGERGVLLSGGERQRIAIARALLLDRPILVLDEATAFADAENEIALMRALSRLMQGRTVIMIAHRLSTIRHADQILVFDGGRLAESGTHDKLTARQGIYARLWRNAHLAQRWTLRGDAAADAAAADVKAVDANAADANAADTAATALRSFS